MKTFRMTDVRWTTINLAVYPGLLVRLDGSFFLNHLFQFIRLQNDHAATLESLPDAVFTLSLEYRSPRCFRWKKVSPMRSRKRTRDRTMDLG